MNKIEHLRRYGRTLLDEPFDNAVDEAIKEAKKEVFDDIGKIEYKTKGNYKIMYIDVELFQNLQRKHKII